MLWEFILTRGVGEFSFDDLKKFARCQGQELDDSTIINMIRAFHRPGVRIEVDVTKRRFRVELDYPDELLAWIMKTHKGRTLEEALEEFRRLFGDFEESRLLRIFRILRDIEVEKEGKRRRLSMITNLGERKDARIV